MTPLQKIKVVQSMFHINNAEIGKILGMSPTNIYSYFSEKKIRNEFNENHYKKVVKHIEDNFKKFQRWKKRIK